MQRQASPKIPAIFDAHIKLHPCPGTTDQGFLHMLEPKMQSLTNTKGQLFILALEDALRALADPRELLMTLFHNWYRQRPVVYQIKRQTI